MKPGGGRCKLQLDESNRKANETAKSIGKAPAEQREALKEEGRRIREEAAGIQRKLDETSAESDTIIRAIPNLSHPAAPVGADDKANLELFRGKTPVPQFDFKPLDHVELGEKLDMIDFEGGARVAGHGFYFLKNDAVLLELALQRYALDVLLKEGFTPMTTPDLARNEVLQGIGYHSARAGDADLQHRLDRFEPGRDGRNHARRPLFGPDDRSRRTAAEALRHEPLFSHRSRRRGQGLPRPLPRPSVHQGRDVRLHRARRKRRDARIPPRHGMPHLRRPGRALSRRRYGHGRPGRPGLSQVRSGGLDARPRRQFSHGEYWGEVTSTSNCTDYQSRRLNIRYRVKGEKGTQFVHTLNGTAIAISRGIIAVMENYQQADGSIVVPEVLRAWMGKERIEARKAKG